MSLDGILAVDKPAGITSHDVVRQLRRVSGQRRIGHAGTLDPLATGLLQICFGRSTRLVEYLMGQPKEYAVTIRLGQSTDSFDADGTLVEERPVSVTLDHIDLALTRFQGTIQQYAPIYSAIKQDGVPLYKLARQGQDVERPARVVTFYELDVTVWEAPLLSLHVRCSPGTYIRSLAHDLGEALGCGGHVTALRRTASGAMQVADAVPLERLDQNLLAATLIPGHLALGHLPEVQFAAEEAHRLLMGQRLAIADPGPYAALADDTAVRAYGPGDAFLGILLVQAGVWQPHKMFLTSADAVF